MASIPSVTPRDCVGDFIFNPLAACGDQPAKVGWLAIIDSDYEFTDISDAAEWTTAIAAEEITIVPCRGSVARPTANKVPASGAQFERVTSYSHVVDVRFDNPDGNFDLMQALNGTDGNSSSKTIMAVFLDFQAWTMLDETGSFIPAAFDAAGEASGDQNTQREGNIIGTFVTKQLPYSVAVPRAVFA